MTGRTVGSEGGKKKVLEKKQNQKGVYDTFSLQIRCMRSGEGVPSSPQINENW